MKVFLDTNVLVSAFATRGLCADLFRLVLAEHELLTGEVNLAELSRVLSTRIKVPATTVTEIEAFLRDQTIVPKPDTMSSVQVRDRSDRWVLASAEVGGADVLVTGDKDLLEVASESVVRILDPRGFWELVRRPKGSRKRSSH